MSNTVWIRKLGTGCTRKATGIFFLQLCIVNKLGRWYRILFTTSFLESPGCNNHYILKTYSTSKLVISFPLYVGFRRFGVVVFGAWGRRVGEMAWKSLFFKVVFNLSFWTSSFGIG